MLKRKISFGMPNLFKLRRLFRFKKPGISKRYKLILGGLLLLIFTSGYEPVLDVPPIRRPLVLAEQTQTINSSESPITFQLPHPGYLSTPYSTYHPALDIATGLGMPIKAIAKGTVIEAGYSFFGLGLMVVVQHDEGYKSTYGHMGRIYVKKDQKVDENTYLGEVGLTGHTSGPHTHLEVKRNNNYIDPRAVLPKIREIPLAEDFATASAKVATK